MVVGQIKNVWAHNLAEEMQALAILVEDYPVIGMDTEFPGVVGQPLGEFPDHDEFSFQRLRCNVDLLKLIQVGFTLCDHEGRLPHEKEPARTEHSTWQFNLHFDLFRDTIAGSAISLLKTAGIDFEEHRREGIRMEEFGGALMSSGLVLNPRRMWVSFHGMYDFGYLLKVLTGRVLPAHERDFSELLSRFFPVFYDIKQLMKARRLYGGLQDVSGQFGLSRVGTQHQAGSDSHLTALLYFGLVHTHFPSGSSSKHSSQLFGLKMIKEGSKPQ